LITDSQRDVDIAKNTAAAVEDDGEPFEEKMARLTAELRLQMEESARLDKLIWANLEEIGCGG
jgi:type I restriction enzyme M protein